MCEGNETVGRVDRVRHASREWFVQAQWRIVPTPVGSVSCASLDVASPLIGAGFALCGVWDVLPFSGLEMVALGARALPPCDRHNEHITSGVDGRIVEAVDGAGIA